MKYIFAVLAMVMSFGAMAQSLETKVDQNHVYIQSRVDGVENNLFTLFDIQQQHEGYMAERFESVDGHLYGLNKDLNDHIGYVDDKFSGVDSRFSGIDNRLSGIDQRIDIAYEGVAAAMAMASIPQAFNGQAMIGFGAATFEGHTAVSVGLSKNAGNHTIKASASKTRNSEGLAVGYGYAF